MSKVDESNDSQAQLWLPSQEKDNVVQPKAQQTYQPPPKKVVDKDKQEM